MTSSREPIEPDGLIVARRLDGAEAIAAHLGKPARWVYQARERRWRVPIRKADGLGLYAFVDELDAWQRDPATLAH